jgi:hypothetical protein
MQTETGGFSMGMAVGLLVVLLVLVVVLTMAPVGDEGRPLLDIRLFGGDRR